MKKQKFINLQVRLAGKPSKLSTYIPAQALFFKKVDNMNSFFTRPSKRLEMLSQTSILNTIRIKSAIAGIQVLADTIEVMKEVHQDRLYEAVSQYLNHSQYENILSILIRSKKIIRDNNNLLKWSLPNDKEVR